MEVAAATVLMEVAAVVVVATSFTSLQATTNGPYHPCADLFVILVLDLFVILVLDTRILNSVIARSPKGDEAIYFFCEVLCF